MVKYKFSLRYCLCLVAGFHNLANYKQRKSIRIMKNIIRIQLCVVILISSVFYPLCSTDAQQHLDYRKVGPQEDGSILVPTNQLLTPAGFQVYMPGRPVDLALIEGGKLLAVKNKNYLDLIRL